MRLVLAVASVLGSALAGPVLVGGGSAAEPQPEHAVLVTGVSASPVTTWPAFAPEVDRFAVRSARAVTGLSVTASSSDPAARVSVNGRPAANGERVEVRGLEAGDEVNVQIQDSGGRSNQSWIVLPAGFPPLKASGPAPGLAEGQVFLTLASFLGGTYTALVDAHGVPTYASPEDGSDFKRAADGNGYSIATPVSTGGYAVRRLDGRLDEVERHQLAASPAASTDFHDSELLPDGSVALLGYDVATRAGATWTDAVIEVQDPTGAPGLTWNSKDHVGEESEGLVDRSRDDYAHINSLQRQPNGDVLASFRNLSQIMLIAGSDHAPYDAGDVIWRLGGLRNDFVFVDDPWSGPCAQHAATLLPDGHLLVFDNGSRRDDTGPIATQTADMCPTPGDPAGPRVARPQSRITEYELDITATPPTARLVWSHAPDGRYAPFAGNAQRLPNGNTFAGWSLAEAPAGAGAPVATEVATDGTELWSLAAQGWFTYRAFKYAAPDQVPPTVEVSSPADGAVLVQGADVATGIDCSDRGGSNLDTCVADRPLGASLTARTGTQSLNVTATDRSGNATTRTVTYTVVPAPPAPTPAPATGAATADVAIKHAGGRWHGVGTTRRHDQVITIRTVAPARATAHVRVRNTGSAPGRLVLAGSGGNRWSHVRWFAGRRDITARVRAGTFRTRQLAPGQAVRVRMVVRTVPTDRHRSRTLRLGAANRDGAGGDVVRVRLTSR